MRDCLDQAIRDFSSILPLGFDSTKLRPAFATQLLVQMASACAYLHGEGIMHRDLKPQNIALQLVPPSVDPPSFEFYLLDFGHAVRQSSSIDHMAGTIVYLAPEIMRLKGGNRTCAMPYTNKVDIWALGLCCWQVFVGTSLRSNEQAAHVAKEFWECHRNSNEEVMAVVAEMLVQEAAQRISAQGILGRLEGKKIR